MQIFWPNLVDTYDVMIERILRFEEEIIRTENRKWKINKNFNNLQMTNQILDTRCRHHFFDVKFITF